MKKSSHEKAKGKHDTLCQIVGEVCETLGHFVEIDKIYDRGQLDVRIDRRIILEIKSNYSVKAAIKAENQLDRAIRNGQGEYGYMVTYQGVYDVLAHNDMKLR